MKLSILTLFFLCGAALGVAQTPMSTPSSHPSPGPAGLEPFVEKNGVRVTLKTSIHKKNEMKVLVKVSNLSQQPVFVSPDAVETTTEEGFVILPSNGLKPAPSDMATAWARISKAASLIPFADPYQIISKTQKVANFAQKSGLWERLQNANKKQYELREVILQPGMATHGLIVYDASSLNAFDYNPRLRIKVTVSGEPFEFVFDSTPLKPGASFHDDRRS